MEEQLFRKESLKKRTSPEDLNKTINITKPSVWFFSLAVLLFLVGLLAWGTKTTITTSMPVLVSNQTVFLEESNIGLVQPGSEVIIGENSAFVTKVPSEPECAEDVLTKYQMHVLGLGSDDWVYCLTIDPAAPDDVKQAELITESVRPMSFFWN